MFSVNVLEILKEIEPYMNNIVLYGMQLFLYLDAMNKRDQGYITMRHPPTITLKTSRLTVYCSHKKYTKFKQLLLVSKVKNMNDQCDEV